MSLYSELRRREVLRMLALYVFGSWVVIQAADLFFPGSCIPESSIRYVWITVVLGLPVALIFSWCFDLSRTGVRRTISEDRGVSSRTLLKIDFALLSTLSILAVGIVGVQAQTIFATRDCGPIIADQTVFDPPDESIAVLPFVNRSARDEDIFFVDGIHDDVLTQLANIGSLTVISRTSVEKFRQTTQSMKEIGAVLGVKNILEGSVQRSGGQVHINVQLIDVTTDDHLWADTYDRQLSAENVFAIQAAIAMEIAAALDTVLSPAEQSRFDNVPTSNFDAYEAYLRGRQSLVQREIPGLQKAVNHFKRAIELDPKYALAHVGLADAYGLLEYYGDISTTESVSLIEPVVTKALSLDPQLGEAYTAKAALFGRQNDLDNAIEAYLKAIELAPGYATSYHWLAELYRMTIQRPDLAWPLIQRAVELDPLSPVLNITLAETLSDLGRHDAAVIQAERVVEIAPNYPSAYFVRAFIEAFTLGKMDSAIDSYRAGLHLDPESVIGHRGIAVAYSHLGADDLAIESIERAMKLGPGHVWSRYDAMQIYDAAGMADQAQRHAHFMHSRSPVLWYPLRLLRDADIAAGNPQAARERYLNVYTMFDGTDPVEIDIGSFQPAVDFAALLSYMGQEERARQLLQAVLSYLPTQSRLGRIGSEIDDVRALAQLGESERALTALAEAVEAGWRLHWRSMLRDRGLDTIRDDLRFRNLEATLRDDMAAQLEHVLNTEGSGELVPMPE